MELTEAQKKKIIELWNLWLAEGKEIKLIELVQEVFDNPLLDGRAEEGKLVKKFLVENGLKFKIQKFDKKEDVILSAAQREFIKNNCANMSSLEITREIFKNPLLTPLSKEGRAVVDYIKKLGLPKVFDEEVKSEKYNIPRSIGRILPKINSYCNLNLKEDTLTDYEKKCATALLNYVALLRFVRTMETYEVLEDREMFESQFIFHTWDKPDLAGEEVQLYIDLCTGYVQEVYIRRIMVLLNRRLSDITEDPDGRASKSLADTISTKNTELKELISHRSKLIQDLIGKRSERKKQQTEENRSILSLVMAFSREEERLKILKNAERERALLKKTMDEYESMPAMIARIVGPSKDEILN